MSDEEYFHVSGIPWPVRSPDLTVMDFFLCAYRNRPHTTQRLKHDIQDEKVTINQELLCRIFDIIVNRFRQCVAWRTPLTRCHLWNVMNKKIACFVFKYCAFHFIPSCCVKHRRVSKSVSPLCATLYKDSIKVNVVSFPCNYITHTKIQQLAEQYFLYVDYCFDVFQP